jgi:hypothetical protein
MLDYVKELSGKEFDSWKEVVGKVIFIENRRGTGESHIGKKKQVNYGSLQCISVKKGLGGCDFFVSAVLKKDGKWQVCSVENHTCGGSVSHLRKRNNQTKFLVHAPTSDSLSAFQFHLLQSRITQEMPNVSR